MFLTGIVFLGGGLGSTLRHVVNIAASKLLGIGFPYGTLTVNIVGSFIMGVLAAIFALAVEPSQHWRLFLTTGVLGGFTTFSAFSLDTALLIERGKTGEAVLYAAVSVGVSLLALFLGLALIRSFAGGAR
jgi:CrcB protein